MGMAGETMGETEPSGARDNVHGTTVLSEDSDSSGVSDVLPSTTSLPPFLPAEASAVAGWRNNGWLGGPDILPLMSTGRQAATGGSGADADNSN